MRYTKKAKIRKRIMAFILFAIMIFCQLFTIGVPAYAASNTHKKNGLTFYDGSENKKSANLVKTSFSKPAGTSIKCTYYDTSGKKTDVWYTKGKDAPKSESLTALVGQVISINCYENVSDEMQPEKTTKIDKVVLDNADARGDGKLVRITALGLKYSTRGGGNAEAKARTAASGTGGYYYVIDSNAKLGTSDGSWLYTMQDTAKTDQGKKADEKNNESEKQEQNKDQNGSVSEGEMDSPTKSEYADETGSDEATQNYIGKVVAWILKKIFGIFSGFNAGIINFCIANIEGNMRVDPPNNFFPLFSGITGGNISDSTFNLGFKIIGFVVLTLDAMIGLYLCMIVDDSVDTPISIFYRIVFACFFITMNRPILNLVNQLFFGTDAKPGMTALFTSSSADTADVSSAVKALFDPGDDNILQQQISEYFSGLKGDLAYIAVQLLLIGATLVMVINILKLMLEIMERWILLNLYYCFAPVVAGFTASKTTSNAFVKFIEGYLSQSFIMVLNIWFVGIFRQILLNIGDNLDAMQSVTAQGNTTGWTIVLFLALLIGILQACSRIDEYLSDMGFTVARTGHQLGAAMLGGFSMATGAVMAAPGKIRRAKNNIEGDKADIQNARAKWASHAESGGPGGVQGMRRQAANMFHDKNFANKVRKNGGVITNGMLQNYMHNGYGRSNFQSLKQAMDNGVLPKNTTMTSDAALSMLKNSAGGMAKKSGITFTDASYDTKNSIGTWRGRNANGDLVTGTFSTSAKGIKNGFNVAPPGEAPLFMNADKGLIGGKFAATNDGKETLAQMRDGTSMLENGEESGIAPDHRISNGMVVDAMEAAGAVPQMVMFADPGAPELAPEPRYWAPVEGGEDYPVMSADDKAAWVGQNADHFYVSQVGDGDDSDSISLSMDQIDSDGNFISDSDPRDNIAVLSHDGNESDMIGMDDYNQSVYAVPSASAYDALSEPAVNSVPLAESEYYASPAPEAVPVETEAASAPASISSGEESSPAPAISSSPSAESEPAYASISSGGEQVSNASAGANSEPAASITSGENAQPAASITSGENAQSAMNQIPDQANTSAAGIGTNANMATIPASGAAAVVANAGAEKPEMVAANVSAMDMEGNAEENKMQTITAGGRGDFSSGHYSNMKIPSAFGEAGAQEEIGENTAKVPPISTMPVKNMPVESSEETAAERAQRANIPAINAADVQRDVESAQAVGGESRAELGTNPNKTQTITLNHDSAASAERYSNYHAQEEKVASHSEEPHQNVQTLGDHNPSGHESIYNEQSREDAINAREEKRAESFLRNAYPVESALAGDRIDGKFAKDSIKPIDFNGYKAMYVANPNDKTGKVYIPADQVSSQWELSMKTGSRPVQQQMTDEEGKKSTYWVINNVKSGIFSDETSKDNHSDHHRKS